MTARDLTLNIAINLGRVSRWAQEGKQGRIRQFLKETRNFVSQLEKANRDKRFEKTFVAFQKQFKKLETSQTFDYKWSEDTLTWANILTHRAKLA